MILPISVVTTAIARPAATITINMITMHTLAMVFARSNSAWNLSHNIVNFSAKALYSSYTSPVISFAASCCLPSRLNFRISSEAALYSSHAAFATS